MTDETLVRRAVEGDAEAFELLAAHHRRSAVRLARTLLGEEDAAEDVAQECLLRLATALSGFRMEAELSTWVYRVTLNLCRDHLRGVRRRSREVPLEEAGQAPGMTTVTDPGAEVDAERVRTAVRAAIDALDDEQKEAIMLRYGADLSYKEIATMTDTPQGTVASRVFRALRRLGQELEPRHLEVRP